MLQEALLFRLFPHMKDRIVPLKCIYFVQFLKTVDWYKQNYHKIKITDLNFMCDFYLLHSNLPNRDDTFHTMLLVEWMTDDYQIQPYFMCFYNIIKFLPVTFLHRKSIKCKYAFCTFWKKAPFQHTGSNTSKVTNFTPHYPK